MTTTQTKTLVVATVAALTLMAPGAVYADGTTKTEAKKETKEECKTETGAYGQTSKTCKVVTVVEEPVHDVTKVDSGIGDVNFIVLSIMFALGAFGLFKVAKATQHLYWFD